MKPLVSVIIPVYNVRPYLREALDSVINQTYRNLEIIIVDDGSTDGSGVICDEYKKDSRVRVIHQENRGLSGARNTGLDEMTGEYVAFLDPDDALHPDMVEVMMEALLRHGAELAVCGYNTFKTEGSLQQAKRGTCFQFEKEEEYTGAEAFQKVLQGRIPEFAWNKLYKKTIWSQLRYPEDHVYEDIYVIPYGMDYCERTVVIPQILADHRKKKGSITQIFTFRNIKDKILAIKNVNEYANSMLPSVSSGDIRSFYGRKITGVIIYWAELCRINADPEEICSLKNEILVLSKEANLKYNVKMRTIWWLFLHWPRAIIPIRHLYRFVKRLLRAGR